MNVFAAASLSVAFPKFDGGQKYNFAGTDALAAQIRLGAPADVFAGASPDAPQALFRAGLVEEPVTFATNKLVLAVPVANPANITSIYDVERPGVKLLIGTATVPIGAYTRQVLNNMGITNKVLPQVVSQEQNVNAISSKVALGTADAGFMYVTDALSVADKVKVIPVPAWAQPPVRYQIAIVKNTQNHADAAAFIKRLTSTAGRKLLVDNGFGVPKLPPVKKPPKKKKSKKERSLGEPLPAPGERLEAVARRRLDRAIQLDELDGIALGDAPGLDDPAVERHLAAERVHDPAQDSGVLLERVGVERGHHAAGPPVAHADHDATGTQAIARPAGLVEAGGTADHDVRAEAPAVDADGLRHARRQHRQRKHVVALTAVTALEAHELDARPGGSAHELARTGRVPRQARRRAAPRRRRAIPGGRAGGAGSATSRRDRIAVVRVRVDRRRRRPSPRLRPRGARPAAT